MNISVLTLFPNMIKAFKSESIISRGIEKGLFNINEINFREYSTDKHHRVDDTPYSGGAGMLLKAEPIIKAYEDIAKNMEVKPRVIYMSPQGKTLNQSIVKEYLDFENIIILCGHYEGVDQRVIDSIVDDEISIGDYVLTGGELPAMVFIDALVRNIPGVLNEASLIDESFSMGLLEYPQYTRPEDYRGMKVPEVLLSGHDKKINDWKREQAIYMTYLKRPNIIQDLINNKELTRLEVDNIIKKYHKEGGN